MSTVVSTCKCKDHIQSQHHKRTGICHHSRQENSVNDHRHDIHLRVHITRSNHMHLPNTLEDHCSEPHNWASAHTHKSTVIRTTSHDVTRCIHVVSFLVFLFLLLPVSSSSFRFPIPLWLGFYAPKGSPIYFGFEIGVPCFLRLMKNYDFKSECTWNYSSKDFFSKECWK